ncbi:MAG: DksA family protein PA5536 (no Zn-finger) [uncultured Sphingomonadaceae bacterium]|uniref:RNA polymerase-binding transcription factor DksA n=1 Tax=uncultured Sphingomonadaceae bacterium TaxID=169976 RepID=A0A6J4T851_9SPHN|nr:MAG: DksA family protein PA5536 (no Zn-finger) [uncultured Sphingomonadaceae bacterium]
MATALKDDFDYGRGKDAAGPPLKGLPSGYAPSSDDEFMSSAHLAYFRAKLLAWREAIVAESRLTLNQLQADSLLQPDLSDRASSETDWGLELRTRDRQRKLIAKINAALRRIDTGDYGYCEVTGEPISLARLEARPIATMTVEAQSRHERQEKVSRDD